MKKNATYTATHKTFHWLTAALMIFMLALGLSMEDFSGPTRGNMMFIHKSTGMLVLALVLLRSFYRLTHPTPALEPAPWWQKTAALATHYALYLCVFAMPLSGWAMSSAAGRPPSFYGLFTLPGLIPVGSPYGELAGKVHNVLPTFLIALIGLHVAAALYHHFIKADDTLSRMLP